MTLFSVGAPTEASFCTPCVNIAGFLNQFVSRYILDEKHHCTLAQVFSDTVLVFVSFHTIVSLSDRRLLQVDLEAHTHHKRQSHHNHLTPRRYLRREPLMCSAELRVQCTHIEAL